MVLCGAGCGFVFDLFRVSRRLFTLSAFVIFISDLAFYIISAAVFFYFTLTFNSGEQRLFEFLGLCLGIIIYFLTLSYAVRKIIIAFIRLVVIVCTFLFKIIKLPVIFVYKPLKILHRKNKTFLKKITAFTSQKIRRSMKNIKIIKKITEKSKKTLETI